jgi:DNA polymerase V
MTNAQVTPIKKTKGGLRPGAGRPKNSGKYYEATKAIRVPIRMISIVEGFLAASFPLYACKVSAGFPSPADDYLESNLNLNQHLIKHPSSTFFLRVGGDSMIEAGIHDGDLLVVDRSLEPKDGKVIIAVLNGDLTVKKLKIKNGMHTLVPENKNYPQIEIKEEMNFSVWGVVTSVIHEL